MQNSRKAVTSLPPTGSSKNDSTGDESVNLVILPARRNTSRKNSTTVENTKSVEIPSAFATSMGARATFPTENTQGNSKSRDNEPTSNPVVTEKMPFNEEQL